MANRFSARSTIDAQFQRARHSHGNVIFFSTGGRDVVDAGGMRENLRFIQQGRRCDMRNHETGLHARLSRQECAAGLRSCPD